MTLWAQQAPGNPRTVDVHVTYGPISITVGEDAASLRSFWRSLGRLLDEIETPQVPADPETVAL